MRSTVVQSTPKLFTAVYDGSAVVMAWTPSLAASNGYTLAIAQNNKPQQPIASTKTSDPTNGDGALQFTQSDADANPGNWNLTVASGNLVSDPITLPQWAVGQASAQLPQLVSAIRHPDGSISATWQPATAVDPQPQFQINRYRIALWVTSGSFAHVEVTGAGANQALLAPGTGLFAVAGAQLRIMGLNSVQGGVATPAIGLVYEPATILAANIANGTATVVWQQSRDSQVTSYVPAIYALEDGFATATLGTSTPGTSGLVTLPTLDPNKHYVTTVIANGSNPSITASYRSNDVPILTQTAATTLLTLDADRLSIGWSYASNAEDATRLATRIELVAPDGLVVYATNSASNGGVFSIPRIEGLFDIRLTPLAQSGTGPSTTIPAPIAQVQSLSIVTDAIACTSALTWAPLANVSFELRWRPDQNAISLPAGTTSINLTSDQQNDAQLAPSIRAVTTIGSIQARGPAVTVSAMPPTSSDVECDFDGTTLSAAWTPVLGATGYRLTVHQNDQTQSGWPIDVSAATLTWQGDFAPSSAGDYQLAVQALLGNTQSLPQSTHLFAGGWFIGSATSGAATGYNYPASTMAATAQTTNGPAGEDIELWLPPICATSIPLNVDVPPFLLENNPNGGNAFPYRLTIAAGSAAWQFDGSSIRTALQLSYQNFLIAAENAKVSAYGIAVLQDAIARHMPQTFAESLYYAYGFTVPNATLPVKQTRYEVRPGMVLSVSSASYQRPAASGSDPLVNGYALTAVTHFDVQVYAGANFLPGIDSFISQLAALGAITVNPPTQKGAGSAGIAAAADVYYSQFAQSFWSVLVPKALQSASDVESSQWVQQFVLASSASYSDLVNTVTPPGATPAVYFRGRSVLTPGLRISVNGSERIVSVGTTVGNVLTSIGRRPGAAAQPTTVQLLRGSGAARRGDALSVSAQAVRFDWRGIGSWGLAQDSFDLPLLPGDAIDVV